jgi:hypothetical protein
MHMMCTIIVLKNSFFDPYWIFILFFIYISAFWEEILEELDCREILVAGPNLEIWVQRKPYEIF